MESFIKNSLDKALEKLLKSDAQLLYNDVNERSISHRLACYLEPFFPDWNVDCEYNREHDDPKRLEIPKRKILSDDTHATTVFPDIIVHKRNTNDNLLVIEMKKTTSNVTDDHDSNKLKAFKSQLGYKFAVFLKLRTGGCAEIETLDWK